MLDKEKIDRINTLARKSKTSKLSAAEQEEQRNLRAEYIAAFRENVKEQLSRIKFVDDPNDVEKKKDMH